MINANIRYDRLIQNALRSVVRSVMSEVADNGLTGEHYFFITFATNHTGVKITSKLKANYPEVMTIILQNQFWDLKVTDDYLEVKLLFNGIAETLVIPFNSILTFVDPSVSFKLDFDPTVDEVPASNLVKDSAVESLNSRSASGLHADHNHSSDTNDSNDSLKDCTEQEISDQELYNLLSSLESSPPLSEPAKNKDGKTKEPATAKDGNIVSLADFRKNKPSH